MSGNLTKQALASSLAVLGIAKRDAKLLVEKFFDVIKEGLKNTGVVKVSRFGLFKCRNKSQRPGRNPKTGVEIPINERRVVTFKASQKLKERVESLALEVDLEEDILEDQYQEAENNI